MRESPLLHATSIRRARLDDAEVIARMVAALSEAEGGPAPDFDATTFRRDGFGPEKRFEALIAEADGRPAGYALFHPSYDTDRVVRAVYLGDLYVEAWARGSGIGRRLAASVARIAAAEGDETMHWTVLRRNTAARRFYARFAREDEGLLHCYADVEALGRLAASPPRSSPAALRPAVAADAPLLGQLVSRLLIAVGEKALPFDAGPRLAADGFGPVPRFRALIAESGSEVAGFALFWPVYDTETGGPLMFLSDLLVEEAWRGRGVALDLMGAAAREAQALGHRGMIWEVLSSNGRARAFYRRIAEESDEALIVNCAHADFHRLAAEGIPVD
jgi:GNAT superfamily N-acetyltransferase